MEIDTDQAPFQFMRESGPKYDENTLINSSIKTAVRLDHSRRKEEIL